MSKTEEKSQLLEQVEETKDEKAFDVNAFTEEIIADKTEKEEVNEESKESEEIEDGTWDSITIDKPEVEEEELEEEDEDWDAEEVESKENTDEEKEKDLDQNADVDWVKVSNELGIEASSKEQFVNAVNQIIEKQSGDANKNVTSDSITMLESLIKLSNRELLAEEMKADGMDEYDIDESLDKMEDSGVLKRESTRIRRQLKNALKNEKQNIQNNKQKTEKEKVEALSQNKKDLQNHLKSVDSYFGGKVSQNEKRNLYKYITSGKFNDEIYDSHANVAEVAWMWRNKEKIKKILFSEGFEKGKAHIFNGITSPSTNRSSKPNPKIKSGEFDVSEFMKE